MALSFLTPSRCVLLIGDDALHVYSVSSGGARLLDIVPWQVADFEVTVSNYITRECGGKPVLILNDMTDQHFKGGQRIPSVSPIDRANVLARKLQVAFPNYPIRGALPVKPSKNTGESAAAGGADPSLSKIMSKNMYLFAAAPESEPITKTISAVKKSMATVSGFCLLPVESADMVDKLATTLTGGREKTARWVVFIGQHHNGSLRQVIIRDGQLAMTRMTPVIDTDTDHEAWARDVSQEFKSTVGYLSRFGFSPNDGVHVIVICNPEAGQALETMIEIPCQYTTFTVTEAAKVLGVNIGLQDKPRYATALHVAWAGVKSRFALSMSVPDLSNASQMRMAASAGIALLLLSGAFFSWQMASQIYKGVELKNDLKARQAALARARSEYDDEMKKLADAGYDVKKILGTVKAYKALDAESMKVMPLIQKIDSTLGAQLRLDSININYRPAVPASGIASKDGTGPKPELVAMLKLTFPASSGPEKSAQETENFKRRLSNALPSYKVTIEKNVTALQYSDSLSGEVGRLAPVSKQQDFVAEIKVQGVVE